MDILEIIAQEKESYLRTIRENVLAGRKIYIYGAGHIARELSKFLYEENIPFRGFAVSNAGLNVKDIQGVPVHSYASVRGSDKCFLVGALQPTASEIAKTLVEDHANYIDASLHIDQILFDEFVRPVLDITTKIGCTVQCHYCPQSLFVRNYTVDAERPTEMTFELFKECIDKTPKNTIVAFAGFVEPFLAKDLTRMMRYTYESGREMSLLSTLVGCDLERFMEIDDLPLNRFVLHVPDVKHYANIPMTDKYFELLSYLADKKKPNGDPYINHANCQSDPHPDVVKLLKGKVTISWALNDRSGNLGEDENLTSKHIAEGRIYCDRSQTLERNVLLPDGSVVLCCQDFGIQHILGNLLHETWKDIHEGSEMQRVLDNMNGKNDDDVLCRHCIYAQLAK